MITMAIGGAAAMITAVVHLGQQWCTRDNGQPMITTG
jgi:hypothetical protein